MRKIKLFIVITFLGIFNQSLFSQVDTPVEKEKVPRFFHSVGISLFSEYVSGTLTKVPFYDTTGVNVGKFNPERFVGEYSSSWNVMSLTYIMRYSFWFIDDSHSLSFTMPLTFGLSYLTANDGSGAYGSLSVPLMLQYHSGVASNFETPKIRGWMVGLGAELNVFPLISSEQFKPKKTPDPDELIYGKHNWIQPALEFSYRWLNRDDNCREVNLRGGYGFSKKWLDQNGVEQQIAPFSIKLAYIISINY